MIGNVHFARFPSVGIRAVLLRQKDNHWISQNQRLINVHVVSIEIGISTWWFRKRKWLGKPEMSLAGHKPRHLHPARPRRRKRCSQRDLEDLTVGPVCLSVELRSVSFGWIWLGLGLGLFIGWLVGWFVSPSL